MTSITTDQLVAAGAALGGAIGTVLLIAKKFLKGWVSDSAHIETVNLLRDEVQRLATLNTQLAEEVRRLHGQNLILQQEMETVQTELRRQRVAASACEQCGGKP